MGPLGRQAGTEVSTSFCTKLPTPCRGDRDRPTDGNPMAKLRLHVRGGSPFACSRPRRVLVTTFAADARSFRTYDCPITAGSSRNSGLTPQLQLRIRLHKPGA